MGASNSAGNWEGWGGFADTTRCCERGKEKSRRRVPQPTAGVVSCGSETKGTDSNSINEKRDYSVAYIFEKLTNDLQTSDHSHEISISDIERKKSAWRSSSGSGGGSGKGSAGGSWKSSKGSGQRLSWKQEIPAPLPDWTPEEQRILMDAFEKYPKAARDKNEMELAIVRARKVLPNKSGLECYRCFIHIKDSRVAYFSKA